MTHYTIRCPTCGNERQTDSMPNVKRMTGMDDENNPSAYCRDCDRGCAVTTVKE